MRHEDLDTEPVAVTQNDACDRERIEPPKFLTDAQLRTLLMRVFPDAKPADFPARQRLESTKAGQRILTNSHEGTDQ